MIVNVWEGLGGKSEGHTLKRGECGTPVTPHFFSFYIFQSLYKIEGRGKAHTKPLNVLVLRRTHSPQVLLSVLLAVSSLHHKGLEQGYDTVSKSTTHRLDIRKCGSL